MRLRWPAFIRPWRHAIRVFVFYQGALAAVALAWCLLIEDLSWAAFGSRLAVVGLGLIAFAMMSLIGAWQNTRSFSYQFSSTISKSILENQKHAQDEMNSAYAFVFSSLVVGLCAIGIGLGISFI